MLHSTHHPQDVGGIDTVGRDDIDQSHLAGGDRPGLVEHDGVNPPGGLQNLRTFDDDAHLRTPAGAHQQCGGSSQPQRTRASNDKHAYSSGKCGPAAGARGQPIAKRGQRQTNHYRNEHRRHPVGEPLNWGLPGLGRLHQTGHLR